MQINRIPITFFNKTHDYNTFFIENNDNLWNQKQCPIYSISINRLAINCYNKWIKVLNIKSTVIKNC